jgi:DNA-binding response OmpR family regulator
VATHLNIVVVEDHQDLRELTCMALANKGHHVFGLSCAEELEDAVKGGATDVFILDLNLPGEDGISLAKRIRQAYPLVGIIMLTARSQAKEKVQGYESGADLYMTKPVDFEELCAALQGFVRRRQVASEGTLTLSKLTLTGSVGSVRLSSAEADMLMAFARAPASRLETWQLAHILGMEMDGLNKASLEVRIVRLRKKMLEAGAPSSVIESIRNVGYQLSVPIQIV